MANGAVSGAVVGGTLLVVVERKDEGGEQDRRSGEKEADFPETGPHPGPLRDFSEKKQLHSYFVSPNN